MSLTETKENDRIEIINKWNIQIREATVIKKDGTEIARTFFRKVLTPGGLKGGTGSDKNDLVETDISSEDADVQAVCNAAWTTQVKADYKAFLIAKNSINNTPPGS
tara:strand:+ start:43 stop:360 length:318 start_codon:yes stop_codon:yes gene_type:complete